jgi:hypothetical protein
MLDAYDGEPVKAAPSDHQMPPPPAQTLSLTVPLLVLGRYNNVTVSGLSPSEAVSIYRTTGTTAGPTCLASPAICLDLNGPTRRIVRAGTGTANASGVATVSIWVPLASTSYTNTYQAVGSPTSPAYKVSNTVTGSYSGQNDDPDGDGLTNKTELTIGTNISVADTDGGGRTDGQEYSAGTNPLNSADDFADADGDGYTTVTDCDDGVAAVNPGATEICDTIDNNCDSVIDNAASWWDTAWPYRVTLTVTNDPTYFTEGAPLPVDLDFPQILSAAGVSGTVDPNSIRVVYQDCAAGQPELPSEWLDGFANLFDDVAMADTPGDGVGALVFLNDRDGNYGTRELAQPGRSDAFAVYFDVTGGGTYTAPSYGLTQSASVAGGVGTLSNTLSTATFSSTSGGMMTNLNVPGKNNVGDMTTAGTTQGVYLAQSGQAGGGWVSPTAGTGVSVSTVYDGELFAAIQSTGTASNAFGGYTYSYTWFQFANRPEVYAKVVYQLDRASTILQNPFWGAGVRPFFVNHAARLAASNGEAGGASVPSYLWAYATFDTAASPYGVAAGWRNTALTRSQPLYDATGTANAGRYLALVGQDVAAFSNTASFSGTSGQLLLNNVILEIYPHSGLFGSITNDFQGTLNGLAVSQSALQRP